jgi:hypothetical protein
MWFAEGPPFRALVAFLFLISATLSHGQCIVTVVGPVSVEGSPATAQQLAGPYGATAAHDGGYMITDGSGHTIRRLWPNGTMSTVVGTWRLSGYSPVDGMANASMLLNTPAGIIQDGSNGYYFCDRGNSVVRRIFSNGTMVRVAGNSSARFIPGNGPALDATLNQPSFLSLEPSGRLWISDMSK